MGSAIGSAAIVLVSGYLGWIFGTGGCVIAAGAAMTGCIVYAIRRQQREKERDSEVEL